MAKKNSTYQDEIHRASARLLEIFPEAESSTVAEAVTRAISLSGEKAYNILVEQAVAIYLESVELETNSYFNQKLTLKRNTASSAQLHPDVEQTDSSSPHVDEITFRPLKSVAPTTQHGPLKSTDDTVLHHPGHSSLSLQPGTQQSAFNIDEKCIEPSSSVSSMDRNNYSNDLGKVLPCEVKDCNSRANETKHGLFTDIDRNNSLQDYEDILPFEVDRKFLKIKKNRLQEGFRDQNILLVPWQENLNDLLQNLPTTSHRMSQCDSSPLEDSMTPVQNLQLVSSLKHPARSSESSLSSNKYETCLGVQIKIAPTSSISPNSSVSNTQAGSSVSSLDLGTISETSTSNIGKRSHGDSDSPPHIPSKKTNLETKSSEVANDDEWPVLVPCKSFLTPRKKDQTHLSLKKGSEKKVDLIDLTDDMDFTDSVCSIPNTDRKPDAGKLQQELMSRLSDSGPSVTAAVTMADAKAALTHSSLQSALQNNLSPKQVTSESSSSMSSTIFSHPLIAVPPGYTALLVKNSTTLGHLNAKIPGTHNVTTSSLTSLVSSKNIVTIAPKPVPSTGTLIQSSVSQAGVTHPSVVQKLRYNNPGAVQQFRVISPSTAAPQRLHTPGSAPQLRPSIPITSQQVRAFNIVRIPQVGVLFQGSAQQSSIGTPGKDKQMWAPTLGTVNEKSAPTLATGQQMWAPTLGSVNEKSAPTLATCQQMWASTLGTVNVKSALTQGTGQQLRATSTNTVLLLPGSHEGEISEKQESSSEVVKQQITSPSVAIVLPHQSQNAAESSHKSVSETLKQFNTNATQVLNTLRYKINAQSQISLGSVQSHQGSYPKVINPINSSSCTKTTGILEMSSSLGANVSTSDLGGTKSCETIQTVQGLLDLPSAEIVKQESKQNVIPMFDMSLGRNMTGNIIASRHLKSIANYSYNNMSRTLSAQSLNAVMTTMDKLFLMSDSNSLHSVQAQNTNIALPVLHPSTSNSKGFLDIGSLAKDKPASPSDSHAHSPTKSSNLSLAIDSPDSTIDRVLSKESSNMEVDSIVFSSVPTKSVNKDNGDTGYRNYRGINMDTDEGINDTESRFALKKTDDFETEESVFQHDSDILECSSCSTSSAVQKCVNCFAGHFLCKSCIEEEIQSVMLSKQKMVLLCTAKSCKEQLCLTSLEHIVDAFLLGLLRKNIQQKEMEVSSNAIKKMEGLVSCPSCKYSGLMENWDFQFVCGNKNCTVRCCRYCKSKWTSKDDHQGCQLLSFVGTDCFDDITVFPLNWEKTDMSRNDFQVKIEPTSHEGLGWNEYFKKTNPRMRIVALWRIQNRKLWERYVVKRKHMVEELGLENIQEKALFHGTKYNNIKVICNEGFDFRVQAANGSALGRGIYFSKSSAYSQKYASGGKYMFIARVLCGQSTFGNQTLTRPPHNPSGRMFDSCVDNVASPTMYTVFDNTQCYPEILFQFN